VGGALLAGWHRAGAGAVTMVADDAAPCAGFLAAFGEECAKSQAARGLVLNRESLNELAVNVGAIGDQLGFIHFRLLPL
jgi:hypothetical protein